MSSALSGKRSSESIESVDPTITVAVTALRGCAAAALGSMALLVALGIAAWLGTGQSPSGALNDGLRIGVIAWLQGHFGRLEVAGATVSLLPSGLTLALLVGYAVNGSRVVERVVLETELAAAQRTKSKTADEPPAAWRMVGLAAAMYAAAAGLLGLVAGVGAGASGAQPNLATAFLGTAFLASLGFGIGVVRSGIGADLVADRLPTSVLAMLRAAAAGVLALLVAGSVVVGVRLLLNLEPAMAVLDQTSAGTAGGLVFTLLTLAYLPTFALWGAAYLVGPGFAVGTGTTVSITSAELGPVPSFPLLAALPTSSNPPGWLTVLLAVPVLAGLLIGWYGGRLNPAGDYLTACGRAAGAAAFAAVGFAVLSALGSGSIGPGRMTDWGAGFVEPFGFALVGLGVGAVLGAVLVQWRHPAHADSDRSSDTSDEA